MTHSNNSRTISLMCELRMFRVLCVRSSLRSSPQRGPLESQSELTLIQASASWSSQQQTSLLWQTSSTPVQQLLMWLWRLTSRWHDAWSPPECSNEIAVQANEYFWLQVPWRSSECFFLRKLKTFVIATSCCCVESRSWSCDWGKLALRSHWAPLGRTNAHTRNTGKLKY